jgi:hypothetical protein
VWIGGGRLREFRVESASVSDCVHGESHMIGSVERWWEFERIKGWDCFSERHFVW